MGVIEDLATEKFVDADSGLCADCGFSVSLTNDSMCPRCGSRRALRDPSDGNHAFECADCEYPFRSLRPKRCPSCGGRRVRRNRTKIAPMPSVRTHPYECKKCGNPFSARDVERMAFCDCGSREVIDRRRSKENPAEPIFYTCENCLEECSLSDRRCRSCGVGKRAYRTVETWG